MTNFGDTECNCPFGIGFSNGCQHMTANCPTCKTRTNFHVVVSDLWNREMWICDSCDDDWERPLMNAKSWRREAGKF